MGSTGVELRRAADSQGLPTFHPEVMTIFTNKARERGGLKKKQTKCLSSIIYIQHLGCFNTNKQVTSS